MGSLTFLVTAALLYWLWAIVAIATHLAITIKVYFDAKELSEPALGISRYLWTAISFVLPIGGMLIYWLMNHSTLKRSSYTKYY
ncbi:hypothetical protein [Desulforamulus aquiferis]|uniref:Cardiolipin synthase N-terminal domain-containing protein n=1 Tax=Desulforamulus aquiferis TaxID=1397668 RepID=A0AAW7ZDN4_9FIRM|nr:hypothetical protein [Desulforamulus aquiferis]MDO7786900.1 hypothetical protein [Desulforamulus aquiferis]RYD03573.1 hypothetical protein N752_19390 [Desulforamulus aquiferis]